MRNRNGTLAQVARVALTSVAHVCLALAIGFVVGFLFLAWTGSPLVAGICGALAAWRIETWTRP